MKVFLRKSIGICIVFIILFSLPQILQAGNNSSNQLNFSITLSGHILFGFGYTHWLNHNHTLETTLYIIPEKGLPFGLNGGYAYYTNGSRWRMKFGGEFTLLVSPPDPDKRKVMPMINFVPGVQYSFDDNTVMSQLWLSYFPIKANKKFSPTGLEFRYGRNL